MKFNKISAFFGLLIIVVAIPILVSFTPYFSFYDLYTSSIITKISLIAMIIVSVIAFGYIGQEEEE